MAAQKTSQKTGDELIIAGREISAALAQQFPADKLKPMRERGYGSLTAKEKRDIGRSLQEIAEKGIGTGTGVSIVNVAREALRVSGAIMEELAAQADELNDIVRLRKYLDNGVEIGVKGNPLQGKDVSVPDLDVLASIEEKTASIRGSGRPRKPMTAGLYGRLTDENYIKPLVTQAVSQLIGHGFTDTPYPVGSIRYVRKARSIHQPVADDEGCVLVFHLPVADGKIEDDLPADERDLTRRMAVAVEFDAQWNAVSVRRFDLRHERKLYTPVNAFIDIVPALTEGESAGESEYYYGRLAFERMNANATSIQKIVVGLQNSTHVGQMSMHRGGEILAYELKNGQQLTRRSGLDVIGEAGDRFGVIYNRTGAATGIVKVVEKPCVQAEVAGVGFGINVEAGDAGVPLKRTQGRLINELASDIVRQRRLDGQGGGDFNEAKAEVTTVLRELADAVPPLKVGAASEQRMSRETFLTESRVMIPYLIGLKKAMVAAPSESIPSELLDANYAKLYKTAALMVAKSRALNLGWTTSDLNNFLLGYGELEENELMGREIEDVYSEKTDEIIKEMRAQHRKTKWHIREEGRRTRAVVREAKHVVGDKIDTLTDREAIAEEMKEAFKLMHEDLGDQAQLRDKLDAIALDMKSPDPKLSIQAGLNLGVVSFNLSQRLDAGQLGDKARQGWGRLKAAFKRVADGLGGADLSDRQAEVLSSFRTLYDIK